MSASEIRLDVVELGHLLAVDVHPSRGQPYGMTWKRNAAPPLLWSPTYQCLYFYDGQRPQSRTSKTATTAQIACFRTWHDRSPDRARIERVEIGKRWVKIGEISKVDYHSLKWEDDAEYTHASKGGSYLYRLGQSFFAIQGKMNVTSRGLIK